MKKRAEFLRLQTAGAKWISKSVIVQCAPNNQQGVRVGFTVTKKTCPLAVTRNRIKRRLRAAAADILSIHAADHHDYVLIGRADTTDKEYDAICGDLKWCLKKLHGGVKPDAVLAD